MGTVIRAKISPKNKYWISKHRHYELKHFCLQYPEWKRIYSDFCDSDFSASTLKSTPAIDCSNDPDTKRSLIKVFYSERIDLIEKTALESDPHLYEYIIKGVTEGKSYTYLRTVLGIPCGKDMYYDRYRKFFWLLNKSRK